MTDKLAAPAPDLRKEVYELRCELAATKEKLRLMDERRQQLEQIVQSAFTRSVRGLSGDRPAAQQDASKLIAVVEDHFRAEQLLTVAEIPHVSVHTGVRWLVEQVFDVRVHQVFSASARPDPVVPAVDTIDVDASPLPGTPLLPGPPVCSTCNDTHMMELRDDVGDSRRVMCTHCPKPCQLCRSGGNGAYCANPRCPCSCHPRLTR